MNCWKCDGPILFGEPMVTVDVNIGACAAGAGNMKQCHSRCVPFGNGYYGPYLDAEREKDKKDAERYRWLHNGDVDGLLIMKGHVDDREDIAGLVDGEELDRMVDEAMNRVIDTEVQK